MRRYMQYYRKLWKIPMRGHFCDQFKRLRYLIITMLLPNPWILEPLSTNWIWESTRKMHTLCLTHFSYFKIATHTITPRTTCTSKRDVRICSACFSILCFRCGVQLLKVFQKKCRELGLKLPEEMDYNDPSARPKKKIRTK